MSWASHRDYQVPIGSREPIEILRGGRHQAFIAVGSEGPGERKLAGSRGATADGLGGSSESEAKLGASGLSGGTMMPARGQELGVSGTTQGLAVVDVDPFGHPATKVSGEGHIILPIDQRPVRTAQDASAAVEAARRAGRDVVLLVGCGSRPPAHMAFCAAGQAALRPNSVAARNYICTGDKAPPPALIVESPTLLASEKGGE